jgi:hypothetical protein
MMTQLHKLVEWGIVLWAFEALITSAALNVSIGFWYTIHG